MIRRGFLYLVLVVALISVPVFQAAHALTHVDDIDNTINLVQVDSSYDQDDTDFDQICLDCLALTAFSIIISILAAFFVNLIIQGQLQELKHEHIFLCFLYTYLTRAPPRV
jgi:hypothetical protein